MGCAEATGLGFVCWSDGTRFCRSDWPGLVGVMGCGSTEAPGLGFVCFVVISPRVL